MYSLINCLGLDRAQHHAMLNLTKAIIAENNMGVGSESEMGNVAIVTDGGQIRIRTVAVPSEPGLSVPSSVFTDPRPWGEHSREQQQ